MAGLLAAICIWLLSARISQDFRRLAFVSAGILCCVVLALVWLNRAIVTIFPITSYQFAEQDVAAAVMIVLALGAVGLARSRPLPGRAKECSALDARRVAIGVAVLTMALALAAAQVPTVGFNLSRDEVLADFDATIFAAGRLMAEVPPEWRRFVPAMAGVPGFMMPVKDNLAWASGYLPMNAALRALAALIASPAWMNMGLVGVSAWALHGIARSQWPDRPGIAVVTLLLFAGSSQAVLAAATSYAMTAHLAANLVWLRLFLRDDRYGHAGCLATGFVACGLHQVIFHPLFVAPFVFRLLAARRMPLAALYIAAYGGIVIFWVAIWPSLQLRAAGVPGVEGAAFGLIFFVAKIVALILSFRTEGVELMLDNLLRFLTWQHALLLPLLIAALAAWRRREGLLRELCAGIGLMLLAVFLLIPWQGHGWGYRYLHGFIGSACLIGALGWCEIMRRSPAPYQRGARRALLALSAFSCFVMLPLHVLQIDVQARPYRTAIEAIRRTPADIVIVDPSGLLHGDDLVRNDPFLRNAPKVMLLAYLDDGMIEELCSRFRVAVFDRSNATAFGLRPAESINDMLLATLAERRGLMARLGCGGATD